MVVCVWVLGPRVGHYAPSFDESLSRCSIFRQVTLLSSVCVCVCLGVWVLVYVRMLHPSATACQDVPCDPFVLYVYVCVCVWAFVSSCMSGCSILWQQPVKMFHLSLGDPFVLCVYMCVCLDVLVLVYVRMLHPLATACQNVPSFVR